jgi:hypothetical protein
MYIGRQWKTKISLQAKTKYTCSRGKTVQILSCAYDDPGVFTTLLRLETSFVMASLSTNLTSPVWGPNWQTCRPRCWGRKPQNMQSRVASTQPPWFDTCFSFPHASALTWFDCHLDSNQHRLHPCRMPSLLSLHSVWITCGFLVLGPLVQALHYSW